MGAAGISLKASQMYEMKDGFIIVLQVSDGGGQMRLAWSLTEWSIEFKRAQ